MTAPPNDDQIRAMLEARAGGMTPTAEREVLDGARSVIAGPATETPSGARFGLRPVITHRSRAPFGLAAVAAAAVVAIAVLGGRPAVQEPAASARTSPDVRGPVVVGSPLPSGMVVAGTDLMPSELMTELDAGRLDGKLVVIPGRVMIGQGRCRGDCPFLKIDGLPELFVGLAARTAGETQASIDDLLGNPLTVLEVEDRHAKLVGWLVAGADAPLVPTLFGLFLTGARNDELIAVEGWLFPNGTEGVLAGSKSWTTAQFGGAAVSVDLDPSPSWTYGTKPRFGTYLLRNVAPAEEPATTASWHVVAPLDTHTTVHVDQPRTDLAGLTIPAADVMSALADGSLDGQVLAIDGELQTVAWECPLDARPCMRFYVDGLPGVAVTWDGGLLGSDGTPGAPVSVTEGRLLVTPRNGHLELLGVLHGELARSVAVGELAAWPAGPRDPLQVTPVDGWLVIDGPIYCAMIRTGGTPCPQGRSLLTPTQPALDGTPTSTDTVAVVAHRGAPGIGQLPIRASGPFLVRSGVVGSTCNPPGDPATPDPACAGGPAYGWLVVARYDPETVLVVTFPR